MFPYKNETTAARGGYRFSVAVFSGNRKTGEGIKRGKALPEGKTFLKCLFERSERN